MSASSDKLPENWIRKESNSRPNEFYYFNKKTGMSQWTAPIPTDQIKRLSKSLPFDSSKSKGKSVQNRLKISNHSIEIKKAKQLKTPAQNRLENFVKNLEVKTSGRTVPLKDVVVTNKSFKPDKVRKSNFQKSDINSKSNSEKKKLPNSFTKPLQVKESERSLKTNRNSAEEIPILFPPKTPGQDRLNKLRNSLNPDASKSLNDEPTQKALHVAEESPISCIKSEFGLSDSNNAKLSPTNIKDEPMDWEPSDIFQSVENKVYNDFINLSYIVPDTNVFLDGISCIRDTIQRDRKYNVLVPFVVLQELDRLKSKPGDSRISSLAAGAIRFIYNQLKSKTQRLHGQKATEDIRHVIDVSNADDKILNCCLQMTQKSLEVILITNDINLSNKALASGIKTMSSKEYQKTK